MHRFMFSKAIRFRLMIGALNFPKSYRVSSNEKPRLQLM